MENKTIDKELINKIALYLDRIALIKRETNKNITSEYCQGFNDAISSVQMLSKEIKIENMQTV